MWNTTISTLYNNSSVNLSYVDLERRGNIFGEIKGYCGSGHNSKLDALAPWCSNTYEIRAKAIWVTPFGFALTDEVIKAAVEQPGSGVPETQDAAFKPGFYLFQNYRDDRIYWIVANEATSWTKLQWCGEGPSGRVDVRIGDAPGGGFTVEAQAIG